MAVFAILALTAIAASLFGSRVWSLFVSDLQAAVRFEVRLAEDKPAPGLHEAKLSGSGRFVYLHPEIIVTNSDIAAARAVPDGGPEQYSIDVEFNASGAEKMRAATGNHIGKPVAILLDGQVVMAPVFGHRLAHRPELPATSRGPRPKRSSKELRFSSYPLAGGSASQWPDWL